MLLNRGRLFSHRYWPATVKSETLDLPSGRKHVFISMRKNDEDGRHETVLNIVSRGGVRLLALDKEELTELVKNADRLASYLQLWEQKAFDNKQIVAKQYTSEMDSSQA